MIHPATELRYINESVGYGVFAKRHIPAGTIVYVRDELEIVIQNGSLLLENPAYRPIIDIYATIEADGSRVLSWDIAKHVNHSCRSNTISSPLGFEIAVRNIRAGEEMTDDYGQFNLPFDLSCDCGEEGCRGVIRAADFPLYVGYWDDLAHRALERVFDVAQPLLPFLDRASAAALEHYRTAPDLIPSTAILQRAALGLSS